MNLNILLIIFCIAFGVAIGHSLYRFVHLVSSTLLSELDNLYYNWRKNK